ncbi:MAG: hypothetical protein ABIS06_16700 [Vicinamibacterales bacterium]
MKDRAEYEAYMQDEWLLFSGDIPRQQESVRVVDDLDVRRVLDVGCGGGLFAARMFEGSYPGIPRAARPASLVGCGNLHSSSAFCSDGAADDAGHRIKSQTFR